MWRFEHVKASKEGNHDDVVPPGAGWRTLVAVVTLTLLGALIAFVAQVLDRNTPVNRADLAALAVAAAVAAAGVFAWLKRSFAVPPVRTASLEQARQVLAEQVEQQWKTESRLRLLGDPEPMPIAWRLAINAAVMSQPHLIMAGDLAISARADDIADLARQFRALKRRRLIITGDGGMGKTTLAVQLLLELLATRTAEQQVAGGEIIPIPVLLPISGWDCHAYPHLHEWLAVRLAQDYPMLTRPEFGGEAAAALSHGGHILPILDGLDELSEQDRTKVIKALNASLAASDPVILTCRKGEFFAAVAQIGRAINGAAVITPKRLTAAEAANYLTACLPGQPPEAWRAVLAALTSGAAPSLAQVASTPLGLWLIRAIYIDTASDPTPLIRYQSSGADALHTHLLDLLIPALIKARPASRSSTDHFRPRRQRDAEATRRYLAYLADRFRPDITRDITWWHIPSTIPHLRIASGITAGLLTGITFGLGGRLAFGLSTSLAAGLIGGFVGGLTACGSWVDEAPGHAVFPPRGRTTLLFQSMRSNLAFGLAFAAVTALAVLSQEIGDTPRLMVDR
ncbi:NACHT domain-containing protein [Nonomuraea endophytica]|uniref:NACHT domain-containing protein n=1 Tax=Nonomuraea endophytica TaxID=714136 RepID=UPI0037CC894F